MATSNARIEANRRNAKLSTGPRTPEGKARSRQNSYKHGLTGEGVVIPDEDVEVIAGRFEALQSELAPSTTMGAILVQRIAMLSVRLERSARQESAHIGEAMRAAPLAFDDRRLAEVEDLLDWIAKQPATNARRLRSTVEGVDLLIKAWLDLSDDLANDGTVRWSYGQWQRLENLGGRRPEDFPMSPDGFLCKLLWDEPVPPQPGEPGGLDKLGRREWARDRLLERFAERVAELRAHRATFDLAALAKDRADSARRAIFDESKRAILARKYESATERGLFRTLEELRRVEAEGLGRDEADTSPDEAEDCETMGSSFTGSAGEGRRTSRREGSGGLRASERSGSGGSRPSKGGGPR